MSSRAMRSHAATCEAMIQQWRLRDGAPRSPIWFHALAADAELLLDALDLVLLHGDLRLELGLVGFRPGGVKCRADAFRELIHHTLFLGRCGRHCLVVDAKRSEALYLP